MELSEVSGVWSDGGGRPWVGEEVVGVLQVIRGVHGEETGSSISPVGPHPEQPVASLLHSHVHHKLLDTPECSLGPATQTEASQRRTGHAPPGQTVPGEQLTYHKYKQEKALIKTDPFTRKDIEECDKGDTDKILRFSNHGRMEQQVHN
ncbi:hypothetical protein E2C01_013345 [Portunus trituberculatus]|uniref:Uncharacterized protein n=1 Tax=Portunus trituberculatus TaxID=210409 RepID=A0A5B7DGV9_PORTR|nr:hypothetical protein [Portunus trituberculatus]